MPSRPSSPPSLTPLSHQPTPLLGGLSPAQFMRRHWQRKPLLIRQALPGIQAPLERDALFELAARDEVETRLAIQSRGRWRLEHGPFESGQLPSLKTRQWTLLVQGANLYDGAAHDLMQRFRFIPDTRLDDVMISYATDGGGVGPHFDSYDVFLLQVHGQRRWRISQQRDLSLQAGMPLKVLRNFVADAEYLLEPGDMLYLPPHVAHDGVAVGECMTCSIGFRAPQAGELTGQFLYDLAERAAARPGAERRYKDAGQPPASHPARLPAHFVDEVGSILAKVSWSRQDVAGFLGRYISEPKAHVFFEPPRKALANDAFLQKAVKKGIVLDRRSVLLYDDVSYYMNGEQGKWPRGARQTLIRLADSRYLGRQEFVTLSHQSAMTALLCEWYCAGWVQLA